LTLLQDDEIFSSMSSRVMGAKKFVSKCWELANEKFIFIVWMSFKTFFAFSKAFITSLNLSQKSVPSKRTIISYTITLIFHMNTYNAIQKYILYELTNAYGTEIYFRSSQFYYVIPLPVLDLFYLLSKINKCVRLLVTWDRNRKKILINAKKRLRMSKICSA
jgi:hypothetical protein